MTETGKILNERNSLMSSVENEKVEETRRDENESFGVRTFLIRLLVIFGVAISWACATQFTKSALNIDSRHFFAPYSLVWFNTCFMSICYPVFLLFTTTIEGKTVKEANKHSVLLFSEVGRVTALDLIKNVLPFLILWIMANYSFGQSLGRISASAASSIMSSNTAMVCILSSLLIHEKLTLEKILAVLFAIGGVITISMDSEFAGDSIGILLVVFSAASAAFYKVLFKRFNGHATLGQVSMFMSFLGLMNLFVNIIPSVILVVLDIDHIVWSAVPWIALAGSAILGLVYNFLVNFGIALLNPLVISIGMLCGIPINAAIDIVFRGMPATVKFLVGAILIIISFVLCTFPIREFINSRKKRNQENSTNDA